MTREPAAPAARAARLALDELSTFADGLDHPEGVTVDAHGTLYAGGEAGQVYRVEEDGRVEQVAGTGGFLLGLCADGDGLLYCCDIARKEVLRVNPRRGGVEVHSRGTPQRPMVNPNWPLFDDAGNLYVTDSGGWKKADGCIYRIARDGRTEVWTAAASNFPNGACLGTDRASLLVLESLTPALVRIPIRDDGSAGERTLVADLTGLVPDGVALASDGTAYVCCYRPDRIVAVTPDGTVSIVADDPEGTVLAAPTNGVWVGPRRDALVVGNLGRWHLTRCPVGRMGKALAYPTF